MVNFDWLGEKWAYRGGNLPNSSVSPQQQRRTIGHFFQTPLRGSNSIRSMEVTRMISEKQVIILIDKAKAWSYKIACSGIP